MEKLTHLSTGDIVAHFEGLDTPGKLELITTLIQVLTEQTSVFNPQHLEKAIAEYAQAARSGVPDMSEAERPNPADRSKGF